MPTDLSACPEARRGQCIQTRPQHWWAARQTQLAHSLTRDVCSNQQTRQCDHQQPSRDAELQPAAPTDRQADKRREDSGWDQHRHARSDEPFCPRLGLPVAGRCDHRRQRSRAGRSCGQDILQRRSRGGGLFLHSLTIPDPPSATRNLNALALPKCQQQAPQLQQDG